MAALTFDTLKLAKRLASAGIPREQAEAEAEAIAEALSDAAKAAELVTKADMEAALARQTTELIKWVAGMLVAQAAVIATLVKLV